jgi:hypothetical protein
VITAEQALAARRLALVAAGLGATLLAHALCAGGLTPTPLAPALWGSFACLAVVVGSRRRPRWREWSAGGTLARLLVVQLTAHLALTELPWAFGVSVHHSPPLLGAATMAAHGTAALLLGAWLIQAQRLLGALVRLVRRLRRALAPLRPCGDPHHRLAPCGDVARSAPRRLPETARGPPLLAG